MGDLKRLLNKVITHCADIKARLVAREMVREGRTRQFPTLLLIPHSTVVNY